MFKVVVRYMIFDWVYIHLRESTVRVMAGYRELPTSAIIAASDSY